MDKMSLREFFSAPTRYLAESISKESEFEKPYLDENPRKMHLDFPWPDWPSHSLPGPLPDIPGGPTPGLSLCAITCYTPLDCDEPIWCHPSIWCGADPMCNLCSWLVEGATSGYSPHPFGGSAHESWGIDIWIDTELLEGGEALIRVQMRDPCGNLCGEDVEVTCKVCPPDVVMTWDSSLSAETVIAGNSAGVYVKDGLGPYSWSVVGTDFSIAPTTEGVSNLLVAGAGACGTATITVTDYCGDTAVGYVRGTTGQWVTKSVGSCVVPGTGTFVAEVGLQCTYEFVKDNKKQIQYTRNIGICTGDGCCDAYCENATYCITGINCANCIDPFDSACWPYTQFPHGYLVSAPNTWRCFCPSYFEYQEWEC